MIQKDILIEDLVNKVPGAVKYLMEQGIRCIACGEPLWGTLEAAAREKGFSDADISRFLEEISRLEQRER